jgi:hypothetical protein
VHDCPDRRSGGRSRRVEPRTVALLGLVGEVSQVLTGCTIAPVAGAPMARSVSRDAPRLRHVRICSVDDGVGMQAEGFEESAATPMFVDGSPVPSPQIADPRLAATAHLLRECLDVDATSAVDTLGPVAALREALAICESLQASRQPPGMGDRRSLRADVQSALHGLGPELKRELQPALEQYLRAELAHMPELIDEAAGVERLRTATWALLERITRPASTRAAWRDLVRAVEQGLNLRTCRLRALQLREIDEALGHEWKWRASRLQQLAWAASFAECEELLGLLPESSAQVAWLVFARADLPGGHLRIGQVQFFSHRLWPEVVTNKDAIERYRDAEYPAELNDNALALEILQRTGDGPHVYVRVELRGPRASGRRNPWARRQPPQSWARELVSGIVEAGTFRVGGSAWRLLDGVLVYLGDFDDGKGGFPWAGTLGFVDPGAFDTARFANPLLEPTGSALEELAPSFAGRLSEGDPSARNALAEVRWYEATQRQDDIAQRIVLYVRTFERTLPTSNSLRWSKAIKRYLRSSWALERVNHELMSLGLRADSTLLPAGGVDRAGREQWLVHEGSGFRFMPGAFLRVSGWLGQRLPRTSLLLQREVRDVARWAADVAAARELLSGIEQRFDRLLARAVRQRNAVVHGIATVPEVVATVEPFIAYLAGAVVAEVVAGAASGEHAVDALEQRKLAAERRLWRLGKGEGPVDRVLFGEEDEGT